MVSLINCQIVCNGLITVAPLLRVGVIFDRSSRIPVTMCFCFGDEKRRIPINFANIMFTFIEYVLKTSQLQILRILQWCKHLVFFKPEMFIELFLMLRYVFILSFRGNWKGKWTIRENFPSCERCCTLCRTACVGMRKNLTPCRTVHRKSGHKYLSEYRKYWTRFCWF